MKKLKCLLGHNLRLMKLYDVIESTYDNDKENITVYKCKYCDKVVATKTNYVK